MNISRETARRNQLIFDKTVLNQVKSSISNLVDLKSKSEKIWSPSELASLIFFVYHMGESDWKSFALEEPENQVEKRSPRELAEKWRDIKYLRQQEVEREGSRSLKES